VSKAGKFWEYAEGKVSLSIFLRKAIPDQLANVSCDLGSEPISLFPSGPTSRFVLQAAQRLVDTGESKSMSNFLKVPNSVKLNDEAVRGYVFNRSNQIWQEDRAFAMTKERAKNYVLSLEGKVSKSQNYYH
jgi:hypothetical protein